MDSSESAYEHGAIREPQGSHEGEFPQAGVGALVIDPSTLTQRSLTGEGRVKVRGGYVQGFAQTRDCPDDQHVVQIHIDGRVVATILADQVASDSPPGEFGHHFRHPIPYQFWDGKPHRFAARIDGTEIWLQQPGDTFQLPPPDRSFGELLTFSNGVLRGWAGTSQADAEGVDIILEIDGQLVVQKRLKEPTEIRTPAGAMARRFQFALTVPEAFIDGHSHHVRLYANSRRNPVRSFVGEVLKLGHPTSKQSARVHHAQPSRSLNDINTLYDMVFVVNINSKGWILEKICAVIAGQMKCLCRIVYVEKNNSKLDNIPKSRAYFFSHYKLLQEAISHSDDVRNATRFVWFTHPVFDRRMSRDTLFEALATADHIFTANSAHRDALIFMGLEESRITTVLGGVDLELFKSKPREGNRVGIVGAFYERKNPHLIYDVIKSAPNIEFLLLGPVENQVANRNLLWTNWSKFDELTKLENFKYVEADYAEFPQYYSQFDIYMSLSTLEGGPIPLLEAMATNSVPVVTDTGFARDLIRHGENGWILPVKTSADDVVATLEAARLNRRNIRKTVESFTWKNFGRVIADIMLPDFPIGEKVGPGNMGRLRHCLRGAWQMQDNGGAQFSFGQCYIALPRSGAFREVDIQMEVQCEPQDSPVLEISYKGEILISQSLTPGDVNLSTHQGTERNCDGSPLAFKLSNGVLSNKRSSVRVSVKSVMLHEGEH